jgi:hypothetical protein
VAYLDVIVVVIGLPIALYLGVPPLGLLIGGGAWLLQRALGEYDRRYIKRSAQPRTQLGLNIFEAFGRIWLLAIAIIASALAGGHRDGLVCAVTICIAYTIAFAVRVASGPPNRAPRRAPR